MQCLIGTVPVRHMKNYPVLRWVDRFKKVFVGYTKIKFRGLPQDFLNTEVLNSAEMRSAATVPEQAGS